MTTAPGVGFLMKIDVSAIRFGTQHVELNSNLALFVSVILNNGHEVVAYDTLWSKEYRAKLTGKDCWGWEIVHMKNSN